MSISEHQPKTLPNNLPPITSVEANPMQETSISILFNKLIHETLSLSPHVKTFRATVEREIFERNNVISSVCKGLFSTKKQRDLVVTITPLMLNIHAFNIGGKPENEKAILGLYVDGKRSRSHLFVADGKNINHPHHAKLKEKSIDIEPEDYLNIAKTVEEIAVKQGLIK